MAYNWKIASQGADWMSKKLSGGTDPAGSSPDSPDPVLDSPDSPSSCAASKARTKTYSAGYYAGVTVIVILLVLLQVLLIKVSWNYAMPQIAPNARKMSFLTALVFKLMVDLTLM